MRDSHTLRGCVDWNTIGTDGLSSSSRHTLRGCVDWNILLLTDMIPEMLSHPSWVCGLKLELTFCISIYCQSHPSWVCGLKLKKFFKSDSVGSHTLRGCVDWNCLIQKYQYIRKVTPFVGVWIETEWRMQEARAYQSHTLRGCVDWNRSDSLSALNRDCHTLRGCVDWNHL